MNRVLLKASNRTLALAVLVAIGGCASSGLGDGPRQDVSARMASIQQPVAACYGQALRRNRKLRGTLVVSFATTPGTGKFADVQIARNDLPDAGLEACVKEHVSGLVLAQPTKTKIGVEYPLNFTPVE